MFESSLIIIHGDTGMGEIAKESNICERVGSTPLLIKKPNQIKAKLLIRLFIQMI